jgi:hypothetical protein
MYIPLTFEGSQAKCLFATGGYEGYFISGSQQWKYHWFTGSANLEVQKGTIDNVQIYVVGGGGGGGNRNTLIGGGGAGGGGVDYTMTGRLFQGTYTVSVGRGGFGANSINTNGFNGITSSFIGSNINIVAGGGGGGIGSSASTGGTGGTPNGGDGGDGGGASGSNGQSGVLISFAGEADFGFGCGGGGASNLASPNNQGFSCNDTQFGDGANGTNFANDGANRYGMGGGGGNDVSASSDGGSGSVMIQYPIFDYCSNYFNETGSCGCRQITFDTTDQLNYYPQLTGSFLYQPCGENKFVSGSLISYGPLTVCAVSNSYYSYTIGDAVDPIVVQNVAGFATSGSECVSASLVPLPCSIENFVPTCTSSVVTIYTPTASVGVPATFGYVAKNETTHSIYTSTTNGVKYLCISTGSVYNNNQTYPQVLSGTNAVLYNTASCNTITISSYSGDRRSIVVLCNGASTTLINPAPGSTYCIDTIIPVKIVPGYVQVPYTVGGTCLSGSFNTGSCGCP